MSRLARPAQLLTAVSLAAGLLAVPGAAWAADTTTSLTGAEMYAALKAVAATTATAEVPGYGGALKATLSGKQDASMSFAADPAHSRAFYRTAITGYGTDAGYFVAGKGAYVYLGSSTERAAAKMAGRPAARYVFQPDAKTSLDTWTSQNVPSASELVADDAKHAGTRTVHDDGSAAYKYTDAEKLTITFAVNADGVVTGGVANGPDLAETLAFRYGAQTVTLPPSEQVISKATLARAVAYTRMAGNVKQIAELIARMAEERAGGRTVTAAVVRKQAKEQVSMFNSSVEYKVITAANVTGGVKISAKNPYTGAKVAYTVKASGKHAVAHKA